MRGGGGGEGRGAGETICREADGEEDKVGEGVKRGGRRQTAHGYMKASKRVKRGSGQAGDHFVNEEGGNEKSKGGHTQSEGHAQPPPLT